MKQALIEAEEAVRCHRDLEKKAVSPADVAFLSDMTGELDALIPRFEQSCASARGSSYYVASNGECLTGVR